MFRGKALLKNNRVLNLPSAASEPRARDEREAAPGRAGPRAQAPISTDPKLTQSAPESRGPPALCKVPFSLHAPAEVGGASPRQDRPPPPTGCRPPPRQVELIQPAPRPAWSSCLAASRAPGRERAYALSPHTQPPAREGPGEPPGPTRTKAHSPPAVSPPASPRPRRPEWARRPRANVPTSPDAGTWRPLRRPSLPPHPALPPLSASRSHLRALPLAADYRPKSPRTPRSLPHSAPGLPRGQGRKGSGVRHLARSSRPLTSISKSGRRKAVRKSEQKCAMAGTSHQERSSPSPAAPPSSGHISQARRWRRPRTPSAPRRPHAARAPLARPPRTPAAAQRLSASAPRAGVAAAATPAAAAARRVHELRAGDPGGGRRLGGPSY